MTSPYRSREYQARRVEQSAGTAAGTVGAAFGASKLRDAYAEDHPERFAARVHHIESGLHRAGLASRKAKRVARVVESGKPHFRGLAAAAALGTVAGGAKRYRVHNDLAEEKARRKAERVAKLFMLPNGTAEKQHLYGPRTAGQARGLDRKAEIAREFGTEYDHRQLLGSAAPMYGHTPKRVREARRRLTLRRLNRKQQPVAKSDPGVELGRLPRYVIHDHQRKRVVGIHGKDYFKVLDRDDSVRLVHRNKVRFPARKDHTMSKSAFGVEHETLAKSLTGKKGDKRNTKYAATGYVGAGVGGQVGARIGARRAGMKVADVSRLAHESTKMALERLTSENPSAHDEAMIQRQLAPTEHLDPDHPFRSARKMTRAAKKVDEADLPGLAAMRRGGKVGAVAGLATGAGALAGYRHHKKPGLAKRDYDTAERDKLAAKGDARPGGRFPIKDRADLHNALNRWADASPADRAFIRRRAAQLGVSLSGTGYTGSGKHGSGDAKGHKMFAEQRKSIGKSAFGVDHEIIKASKGDVLLGAGLVGAGVGAQYGLNELGRRQANKRGANVSRREQYAHPFSARNRMRAAVNSTAAARHEAKGHERRAKKLSARAVRNEKWASRQRKVGL